MTGAYLRVERKGEWENIEVEYLTDDERKKIFIGSNTTLLQWLNLVCNQLAQFEQVSKEGNLFLLNFKGE